MRMEPAKEFLMRELNMTPIQANTMYDQYIIACEKYAELYHKDKNDQLIVNITNILNNQTIPDPNQ